MFSLNFSSKFESYKLQHCKKNCLKLVFCVFLEQPVPFIYIALAKKFHNLLLQKCENKIFKQKRLYKKLVESKREKYSGILRLNEMMSKLLTISTCLQLNC